MNHAMCLLCKKDRFNIDKHCLLALIFICSYNNNGKQHSPLTHSIVSSCKQQASNKQHHNGKQQATMAHSIMTSTKQQTIHTMTSASMYVCSMCMHVLHVCVCVCMCCACQLCTCACVCLCMQYLCVECLCMLVCLCACACVSVCVCSGSKLDAPEWQMHVICNWIKVLAKGTAEMSAPKQKLCMPIVHNDTLQHCWNF
jgi:hypothetical protein